MISVNRRSCGGAARQRCTLDGCETVEAGVRAVKKGRHRRYEEARKFKRSYQDNLEGLIESLSEPEEEYLKPEHAAWAEEFANTAHNDDPAGRQDDG